MNMQSGAEEIAVVVCHAEPIRVLLVDDHDHVLWGLGKLIDGEWPRMMVIGTAKDLSQAAAIVGERKPDIVLLDLYLGGEFVLDRLPGLLAAGRPEVLIMTDTLDAALHDSALQYGAAGVMLKQAPAEELLRQIERAHLSRTSGATR